MTAHRPDVLSLSTGTKTAHRTDGIYDQLTYILCGKVSQAEARASQPGACPIDSKPWNTQLGIDLEIVPRDPTTRGFYVQPRR